MIELHIIVNDLDSAAPFSVSATMDLTKLVILRSYKWSSGPLNALKELGHLSFFTPKYVELCAPTNHWSSGAHFVEIEKNTSPKQLQTLVTYDSSMLFAKVPNIFS